MAYQERYATAPRRQVTPPREEFGHLTDCLTRNERIVLSELQKWDIPAKAYDLLENLIDEGIRSPMTIYRALDSLIWKGLAKKVASLNAFVAVPEDGGSRYCAFFTCKICGTTRKVELNRSCIEGIFGEQSLLPRDVYIEAHGECCSPACQNL